MNEYLATAVDEAYRLGVRDVVFSPGSRSTALALLFTAYDKFNTYMNIDERAAGFFALGIAKETGRPVILVCTSGSAGAHYYPAVVEAKHSRIPLIILTADRPPEWQCIGAPQTMDQVRLFGTFVNHSEVLATPADGDWVYPRRVMQKAVMAAITGAKGPVHINVPMRDPLVPSLETTFFEKGRDKTPFRIVPGCLMTTEPPVIEAGACGVLLCGPDYDESYREAAIALAERLQIPLLADPLSPVRRENHAVIIDSYDAFLTSKAVKDELKPDYFILFGQIPVSKRLQQFVGTHKDVPFYQVDPVGEYRNFALTTSTVVMAHPAWWATAVQAKTAPDGHLAKWQAYQQAMRAQLNTVSQEQTLFEGRLVKELQQVLGCYGKETRLVTANSMSVRDLDYFWEAGTTTTRILGNRGVNGIDGTESTALGVSTSGYPTVMITGDLSFAHDLNGLIMGKTEGLHLVIVLFNNDGGGIFEYLPQRDTPYFEYLFATPHGLDFRGLERLTGLTYAQPTTYEAFRQCVKDGLAGEGIYVIEVKTDRECSRLLHGKYTVLHER